MSSECTLKIACLLDPNSCIGAPGDILVQVSVSSFLLACLAFQFADCKLVLDMFNRESNDLRYISQSLARL